jgi:hypothetical protein
MDLHQRQLLHHHLSGTLSRWILSVTPTLLGSPASPAVAVTGVWDPLLPAHGQLFATLVDHARQSGLAALAVVLHPNPVALMQGMPDLQYDDVHARIALLRAAGIDAVLRVDLTPDDLRATPADFFAALTAQITVAEFWLGARQSLGVGTNSAPEVMDRVSRQFGIPIRRLPDCDLKPLAAEVRGLLASGRIREATTIVGHAPLRCRPEAGPLRLAWPPGRYRVAAVDGPDLEDFPTRASDYGQGLTPPQGLRLRPCGSDGATGVASASPPSPGRPRRLRVVGEVVLEAETQRLSVCEWPATATQYLAFLAGPGDAVLEPAGSRPVPAAAVS